MKQTIHVLAMAAALCCSQASEAAPPVRQGGGPWADCESGASCGMMGPGYGMGGPGMMGGWNTPLAGLTPEQRSKIAQIRREQRARQWPLMQQMHEIMWSEDAAAPGDEQAQRRAYDRMAVLQKQMFENALASRKQIEAVLTPEQREELRRDWKGAR